MTTTTARATRTTYIKASTSTSAPAQVRQKEEEGWGRQRRERNRFDEGSETRSEEGATHTDWANYSKSRLLSHNDIVYQSDNT